MVDGGPTIPPSSSSGGGSGVDPLQAALNTLELGRAEVTRVTAELRVLAQIAKLEAQAEAMLVGDPLDPTTQAGAVNSEQQLAQNLAFVEEARAAGRNIVCGGMRIHEKTGGTFMAPTIVTGVQHTDRIVQEEVFGPVVTVQAFDSDDEAVALANDSAFGLSAGVWTADLSRAHRMISRIKAGVVHVNTYGGADVTVPLGGVKQSGNGHDKSLHAFDKYLDLKTAWIKL